MTEAQSATVRLRVGDAHTIRLPGLGTAGYRWEPTSEGDEGVAEIERIDAGPPPSDAIGASAEEGFRILALQPGVIQIAFDQRRPFDPSDAPAARRHVLDVHVQPS